MISRERLTNPNAPEVYQAAYPALFRARESSLEMEDLGKELLSYWATPPSMRNDEARWGMVKKFMTGAYQVAQTDDERDALIIILWNWKLFFPQGITAEPR
jgi:hypothetical protein